MKSATKRLVDKCRTINFCWRVLAHYGDAKAAAAAVQTSGLDGASWSRATALFSGRERQFAPLPTEPRANRDQTGKGEYLRLMEQRFSIDKFTAITWYTHGPDGYNLWEILLTKNANEIYRLVGTELRSAVNRFGARLSREAPLLENFEELCCFIGGSRAAWFSAQPHIELPRWAQPDAMPRVLRQFFHFNPVLAVAILELISTHDHELIARVYHYKWPDEYVYFDFASGRVESHLLGEHNTLIEVERGHSSDGVHAMMQIERLTTPKRKRIRAQ